MTALLVFFIAGIALLAVDAFICSVVMALIGGLSMAVGCVLSYGQFGILGASLISVASLLLLCFVLYAELILLPKSRLGKGLVVESTTGSRTQPPITPDAALMDALVVAETILAPSGYVLASGRRYEAFCRSGHADKGSELRVVGVDNFRLIVTKP